MAGGSGSGDNDDGLPPTPNAPPSFDTPRVLDPLGPRPALVDPSGNPKTGGGFGFGGGGARGSSGASSGSSGTGGRTSGSSGSRGKGARNAGGDANGQNGDPKCDTECEKRQQRDKELGTDPRNGQFRQREADLARRIEQQNGVTLRRSPDADFDFIDQNGRTYDGVGPVPSPFFDQNSFNSQLLRHLNKGGLDFVPVDLTGLNSSQIRSVDGFISGLSEAQRSKVIKIGF